MSASLIVLLPLVLLGVVTALCFVGCGLVYDYSGYTGINPYRNKVTTDPNIVACWPLDDQSDIPANPDGAQARDIVTTPAQFNGTYKGTSDALKLRQPGIVPGDMQAGASMAGFCALFDGALVNIPFADALNPTKFTIEAWVRPSWVKTDLAVRAVMVAANTSAAAGYALIATLDNFWQIQIGVVGQTFFPVTATDPIDLTADVHYLAATYDGTKLTLFVGTVTGSGTTFKTYSDTPPAFVPETTMTATPLFIAMGRPDMGGMFPFNGFIQDAAIYSDALSAATINDHFNTGKSS